MEKSALKKTGGGGHAQKAYAGIRRMLFHNKIVPGQKISYRDLSERLGMSQTPVIQALKWLEFQGLVRHEPNRGYFTAPISLREVEEIYEFRQLIEISLLPRTIDNLDTAGLTRLEVALNDHLKASREVYLYHRLEKDMVFHLTLSALSGHHVKQQALGNLFDLLYLKYGGSILFSTSMEKADADHHEIYSCIAARNLEGARCVLSRHIEDVKAHVLKGLKRMRQEQRVSMI